MFKGPILTELRNQLETVRSKWLWFVVLGIALIVLGMMALVMVEVASLATTIAVGSIILVSGAFEVGGAFWCKGWNRFFLHLLSGVLGIVVGILFLTRPGTAMITLTLLIASFLLVGGVFKIVASLVHRFPYWGWMLLSGVIDLALGLLIWQQWPDSALWVIGTFVGISMIFRGVDWLMLGLGIHTLPGPATTPTETTPATP
jgi:uncharacterized membrane protein HdeD (DUF308 family)